jgi:hypothetical protein
VAFIILLLVIYKAASGSRPKILQELLVLTDMYFLPMILQI